MSLFAIHEPASFTPEPPVAPVDPHLFAQDMAALQLAYDLASALDAPVGDVWFSLCNLPASALTLLESPQGWSALAIVIGNDLGVPAAEYQPRVH